MLNSILATLVIVFILILSEYLWRKKYIKAETARKLVHIVGGCFVATLPFWIDYNWIIILSSGVIALSILNHYRHFLKAGISIKRLSYGDLFFGFSVLLCALLHPTPWLFAVAILHVALADGLAAVTGLRFSKRFYKILGHKKSVIGTGTFIITSFLILFIALSLEKTSGVHGYFTALIVIPLVSAALENFSGFGTDNVSVPLAVLGLMAIFRL
jgi:phytol kinase